MRAKEGPSQLDSPAPLRCRSYPIVGLTTEGLSLPGVASACAGEVEDVALNRRLLVEGHSPGSTHSYIYRGTMRFGRTRLVVPSSRRHVANQRSCVGTNPPPIDIIEAYLRPSVALGILFSNSRYSSLTVDAPNTGEDQ